MSEINLLTQKPVIGKELRALTITRYIAIGMLLFVTVASSALFFLNIQSPLPKLIDQEKQLLASISAYDKRANTLGALNERLTNISALLNKRTNYGNQLDTIVKQVPNGVAVSQIILSEKENKKISFTATSKSLSALNTFVDNMSNIGQDQKVFKDVLLSDITFDGVHGNYTVSVTVVTL